MQNLVIGFVAGLTFGVAGFGLLIYWLQEAVGPKF